MKSILFLMIFLTAFISVNSQNSSLPTNEPAAGNLVKNNETTNNPVERTSEKTVEKTDSIKDKTPSEDAAETNQSPQTQQPVYVRPTGKKRFSRYLDNTVGPTAFIGPIFGAGINTASNSPPEWGKTGKGFGRRFLSEFGKNAIQETTTYALDEAFKLDSNYYRSTKKGFAPRLQHAVISSFTARNKNGKVVFGFQRITGIYAAEIIANEAWHPKRFSYKDGLREGTISVGANVMINIFREFIFK